ncbi:hypothetical protein [Actinotalea sp.]|uniref:hypothetical protein n=1 Tax=Actinotalea sp. TaxID=1872145 RepID=UPI003569C5FE
MPLHDPWDDGALQEVRRTLRQEKLEVGRWRRLLRARLDLLVGAYAPPEILGTTGWEHLPPSRLDLPLAGELAAAIWTGTEPEDRVALMRRLRDLDRSLAAYAAALDGALDDTTDELLTRMGAGAVDALAQGLAEAAGDIVRAPDVR